MIAAMGRWLGLVVAVALGLGTTTASAQVFKPKTAKKTEKKATAAEPKATAAEPKAAKKTAKKQPRTAPTKKRVTTKSKKSAAAERSRPDDLTPEPAAKSADKDYVKIWDDDNVE